jgi:hypothetical protein
VLTGRVAKTNGRELKQGAQTQKHYQSTKHLSSPNQERYTRIFYKSLELGSCCGSFNFGVQYLMMLQPILARPYAFKVTLITHSSLSTLRSFLPDFVLVRRRLDFLREIDVLTNAKQ